jgi:hypothetical protein
MKSNISSRDTSGYFFWSFRASITDFEGVSREFVV